MSALKGKLLSDQLFRTALPHLKNLGLALLVIAAGIGLGHVMITPSRTTVASLVAIIIYFIVTLLNPLHGLLLWLVTQPLADLYVNLPLGGGIPDLTPTRFCLMFICILLFARVAVGRTKLVPFTKIDLVAFTYLFGITLSAPNGVGGWLSLKAIFDYHVVPVLVYFLAKNLVRNEAQFRKVIVSTLVLATYIGLYAIYEQFTGHILFDTGKDLATDYGGSGLRILRGLLGHPHPFGRVLGIAIPINFYLLLEEKRAVRRILHVFAQVVMFVGLYCTFRRTAWIAVLASLFLIQWFYPRFRNIFLVLLVVASVALYINRDQLSDTSVSSRVQAGDTATLHGRTEGWAFAFQLWRRQPITGHGYGQYESIAQREGASDVAVESTYYNILVSSGLVGFVPYVALLLLIPLSFVKTLRSDERSTSRWLIVMYWAAHLSYMINGLTGTVNKITATSLLLLLAGALTGLQLRSSRASEGTYTDRATLSSGFAQDRSYRVRGTHTNRGRYPTGSSRQSAI